METKEDQIVAYLDGKLSLEEEKIFERECAQSEELRKELDDYRFIYQQSALLSEQSQFRTRQNWDALEKRIRWEQKPFVGFENLILSFDELKEVVENDTDYELW